MGIRFTFVFIFGWRTHGHRPKNVPSIGHGLNGTFSRMTGYQTIHRNPSLSAESFRTAQPGGWWRTWSADRHAGLAQQSGFMDVKALYMYSWELLAGPREKFEHGTLGCNVYYSICCFLLVIYLHLHSSGSFSPGRHNLAPTLMELDFKKNNHMWGRRGDSSKNPWLDNCPACSVHQTCRWVGTTCGAMVAVRIFNGDAICSGRTHGSIHL